MEINSAFSFFNAVFWIIVAALILTAGYLLVKRVKSEDKEPLIIRIFNKWWRPEYKVVVGRGARLERVVEQNKKATVWWDITSRSIAAVVLSMLFVASLLMMYPAVNDLFLDGSSINLITIILISVGVFLVLTILTVVVSYWVLEWQRQNKRLVVFTDDTYYAYASPTFLAIIGFGAKRVYVSSGPTSLLEEILLASDVEDLGGINTSWLRDQWTELLAGKEGVGSIFLPSRVVGAQDTVAWVSHARGLVNSLKLVAKKSARLNRRVARLESLIDSAAIGSIEEEWTIEEAERREAEMEERLEERYPESGEMYDLFTVEDPNLYDKVTGREIKEEEVRSDPGRIFRLAESKD